jgi:hypothetical protein
MALTLTEAAKFTVNMVKRGVLETIIKDSPVLQRLPFTDVVGNALQYLQESTLGSGTFYDPGEVWTEQTPTFVQKTAGIKIMGGDADIDEFLKATRSDKTDLESSTIQKKAKGVRFTFLDRFYYGNSATNSKEFDGLHVLIPAAQQLHAGAGAVGAALSVSNHLDPLFDLVRDGNADLTILTRNLRRRISQYIRANGGLYQAEFNEVGQTVRSWNDVPIVIDDMLLQTEAIAAGAYTAKTGGVTSTVFTVRFGSDDLEGLQNGGLSVRKLGTLESKDAQRWRIRWYVGLALFRDLSAALIDGINDAAVVA